MLKENSAIKRRMALKSRESRHTNKKTQRRTPNRPERKGEAVQPASTKNQLRVIPIGGLEEIGRNMAVIEYNDQCLIIDMGIQFPESDMPGIDYIIPNISYFTDNKEKQIVGVIITHGHMDHFGAIPHLMPKLGYPPLYAARLTKGIIMKRQTDFPESGDIKITEFKKEDTLSLSPFKIEFFHVNHNIPDSVGVVVHSPAGTVMHTGDFKFDHAPIGDYPADLQRIVTLGAKGIDILMSDSTNAESPGYTISESVVQRNLEELIKNIDGRVIAATFGSLTSRIQQFINIAEKQGRYIALDGYSMRTNFEIARELGYIITKRQTVIPIKDVHKYPDNKVIVVCTGAQGEGEAVLMRIANKEHRFVQLQQGDSVIFSSSVVPGNERSVQILKDVLMTQGAKIYHSQLMDIHASGHAQAEDLKLMLNLTKPTHLIPIHGHRYMRQMHADLANEVGIRKENIAVVDNGQVITMGKDKKMVISKERVNTSYVMVDGLGIGDVGQVVLRDRQILSEDGMIVIISIVDSTTGKVRGSSDIISRGFVYLRESKPLLSDIRKETKKIVEEAATTEHTMNVDYIKDSMREELGKLIFKKTKRRPMILPVVIEV